MSQSKKRLGLLALSALALASCSDPVYLPKDYEDDLFTNIPESQTVVQNTKEEYYNAVISSDSVYQKAVKDMLLKVSTIGHDYTGKGTGSAVYSVINDFNKGSVADGEIPAVDNNLVARAEDSFNATAMTSTYQEDNLFYEQKYVDSLISNGNLPYDFDSKVEDTEGILVTPEMSFDEIYKNDYTSYMADNLYGDYMINYLTAEYIYNVSYSSIGNTNARKLQIVSITDRSDEPGDAKLFLDAYVRDFVRHDYAKQNYEASLDASFFQDNDFYVLSRLWKGIPSSVAKDIADDRYDNAHIVLSEKEEAWLRANNLLSGEYSVSESGVVTNTLKSKNLMGKVFDDMRKLALGNDDYKRADLSLESTYTGSYAYSTEVGVRKAIDTIALKDLVTDGIFLKSDSISAVPSDLKNRIFSPKVSTSKTTIDKMKENKGTREDYTVYENDGFRYMTKSDTLNTNGDGDDIIYYDSDSSSYCLVRVLDAIDTNALNKNNTDSIYYTEDGAKREQIAREVAYAMSTTGSYKTDSASFWLSRCKINYSDEDFLDYMKTNYKDVFKTDNPYHDTKKYPTIVLPDTDAGTEGV